MFYDKFIKKVNHPVYGESLLSIGVDWRIKLWVNRNVDVKEEEEKKENNLKKDEIIKEFKEYNDSYTLEFEGEYLNGKRNGKGKEYYDNGTIKFIFS